MRNDDVFARAKDDIAAVFLTQLHAQRAFDDEEELILFLMMVPMECTFQLGELDLKIIDIAADAWAPCLIEGCKSFGKVHLF